MVCVMPTQALVADAERLLAELRAAGLMLATAESCTGGLICATLTEVAGSSDVVDRAMVTYSNEAKQQMLGVPAMLIARHGAVSREVAIAMAEGALARSRAHITVAVTGVAGPGGGSPEKPVGLVHLACTRQNAPTEARECRFGDIGRARIRQDTVAAAFELIRAQLRR